MKRRHCIKSAVMGTGAIGLSSFPHHLYAGEIKKHAYDRVILGNTGIEVSRMAMETAADDPWAQVMLSRYNPGEAMMDGSVAEIRIYLNLTMKRAKV